MTTHRRNVPIAVAALTALSCIGAAPSLAQSGDTPSGGACFDVPEPVVSLSYGSRYTDESADRSDIDAESNAAVDAALGPIDRFISDLAATANDALRGGDGAGAAAACVTDALAAWAEAGALGELETMNAQLSSPSRVAGIAMAWLQVKMARDTLDPDDVARIDGWLNRLARQSADWFDSEAPTMASQNNLRAWAALAAAAVGEATDDGYLKAWANLSIALVACQADEAGALPYEMSRGPRALHYQLHATAPLVVASALLQDDGYTPFEMCDRAVHRVVGFLPRAFEDPALVEDRAGEPQTFTQGDDELQAWELAWAEAYLSIFDAPDIEDFVADYRPFGHSKLGGSQSVLW